MLRSAKSGRMAEAPNINFFTPGFLSQDTPRPGEISYRPSPKWGMKLDKLTTDWPVLTLPERVVPACAGKFVNLTRASHLGRGDLQRGKRPTKSACSKLREHFLDSQSMWEDPARWGRCHRGLVVLAAIRKRKQSREESQSAVLLHGYCLSTISKIRKLSCLPSLSVLGTL